MSIIRSIFDTAGEGSYNGAFIASIYKYECLDDTSSDVPSSALPGKYLCHDMPSLNNRIEADATVDYPCII